MEYKFKVGERIRRFEDVGRIVEQSKDAYERPCYYVRFTGSFTPGFYDEKELKPYQK